MLLYTYTLENSRKNCLIQNMVDGGFISLTNYAGSQN